MTKIIFPFDTKPSGSNPVQIIEGMLWFRLPLPMALDHVNVYAMKDDDGWTVIDTGFYNPVTIGIWENILKDHLDNGNVHTVILTHHHPDHVGMGGWFMSKFGSQIYASQIAWLTARMLLLDVQPIPVPEAIDYLRLSGMKNRTLEEIKGKRPFNFSDCVHRLPPGYTRLSEGNTIKIGGYDWFVRIGNGHAPAHVTLWQKELQIVIAGDQFLPDITPNIGVHMTEPEANPLSEWLVSCSRFHNIANEQILVLPGHKDPFKGLNTRISQLIEFHYDCLDRLALFLEKPNTVINCFEILFGRRIPEREFALALAEARANLNYLYNSGTIKREINVNGALEWYKS